VSKLTNDTRVRVNRVSGDVSAMGVSLKDDTMSCEPADRYESNSHRRPYLRRRLELAKQEIAVSPMRNGRPKENTRTFVVAVLNSIGKNCTVVVFLGQAYAVTRLGWKSVPSSRVATSNSLGPSMRRELSSHVKRLGLR
jgi:hypothetical protein